MAETDEPDNARLRAMLDEWECVKLQQEYWLAETRQDPDRLAGVFTTDATLGSVRGREEIRGWAASRMGPGSFLASLLHRYSSPPVIADFAVTGDTARGTVYGLSIHHFRSPEGVERVRIVSAGYDNRYQRTADGWRISSMHGIENPDGIQDMHWRFEGDMATGPLF
ncbi:nuclear transport factor 2 family protein [Nocardia harenae]|uniref:nuclear transport factor 2 family protein n=1 Tax=Nocardia harenae TaxID=358707 RepID=UPI00082957B3|nr:nuclear transport factor 2 family protein [Nocardia harenae]